MDIRPLTSTFGAFVFSCGWLHGQQASGTIVGAVVDPTGGVVPNVAVTFVPPKREVCE